MTKEIEALNNIVDRTNYLLDSHGGDMKAQEADYNLVKDFIEATEGNAEYVTEIVAANIDMQSRIADLKIELIRAKTRDNHWHGEYMEVRKTLVDLEKENNKLKELQRENTTLSDFAKEHEKRQVLKAKIEKLETDLKDRDQQLKEMTEYCNEKVNELLQENTKLKAELD